MNLLNELSQLLSPSEKAVARLTDKKADGVWVAQTLAGGVLVLTGQGEAGKQVYYDRTTSQIISLAPDVKFERFGV